MHMNQWVKKLVENALGLGWSITDWSDLECERCDNSATHVLVDVEDAINSSDIVILQAFCDECFEDAELSCCWMHKND